jgi:hypothetical protein
LHVLNRIKIQLKIFCHWSGMKDDLNTMMIQQITSMQYFSWIMLFMIAENVCGIYIYIYIYI